MRLSKTLTLLFGLYCIEAGVLLVFAPWSPVWDRTVVSLPIPALRLLCLHPVFRGAVSGFGLIHLVWGAHDLLGLVFRRKERAGADV
jgi:hypothetical protein